MHSVKQGADMDTFEQLGYDTVDTATWNTCNFASRAVRENRAGVYNRAFNLTVAENGASMLESLSAGIEYSNATMVLGVSRDAYTHADLDDEAAAWDWRFPYPPRVQGPNAYHSGDVNWYANQADDVPEMHDATFMDWYTMNQDAARERFMMINNGTLPAGSPGRRTMSGKPAQRGGRQLTTYDIGFVSYSIDSSVPSLEISADWRSITFTLEISGAGNSFSVKFEAEGCMYEVLCLTGDMTSSNPVRHFTLSVTVALKISNIVDPLLDPLPGWLKNAIMGVVEAAFDKEYGRIDYDYYRSARIHEKWNRIKTCAPCHILKARLNLYAGNALVNSHLRGFLGVAAVWAPGYAAHGERKWGKKDDLWSATEANKHIFMQGTLGFEYKIPGLGIFTGWQNGWSMKLFTVSAAHGSRTWWTKSQKKNRVDNKITKAWDYKYGYGNNDKVDQFYY